MTVPQYSVYSSSKRALLGFSLTARAELEKDRIVLSEVYPFITATNFDKNRMGIWRAADRHRITPRATSRNSWPVSLCKPLKKGRLSISRMIASVKWPGSRPRASTRCWSGPRGHTNPFRWLDEIVNATSIV